MLQEKATQAAATEVASPRQPGVQQSLAAQQQRCGTVGIAQHCDSRLSVSVRRTMCIALPWDPINCCSQLSLPPTSCRLQPPHCQGAAEAGGAGVEARATGAGAG